MSMIDEPVPTIPEMVPAISPTTRTNRKPKFSPELQLCDAHLSRDAQTKSGVRNCHISHLKSLNKSGLLRVHMLRHLSSQQFQTTEEWDEQQAPRLSRCGRARRDARAFAICA